MYLPIMEVQPQIANMMTRKFEGYFCLVIIAVILHPSLQAPIPVGLKEREINGKIISCIPTNCSLNESFEPCQLTGQRDTCIPCPEGTVMLDPLDTSQWDYAPGCVNPGCDDCQAETTLANKDSCGKTEIARCECDRTKLFYGNDPHKCIRFNGDCNLEGFQLTQTGVCERCPNGTEKHLNDSSLCMPKIQQLLNDTKNVTTDDPGQGEGGFKFKWWVAVIISVVVAVVIVILAVKVNPCNIRETLQRKIASIRRGRFTRENAERYSETLERKIASIRRGKFTRENAERYSDVSGYMNAIPCFRNEPPEVDPEHNDELDDMNEDNNIAYSYTEDTDSSCNTSNHDGIQHQTNVESVVSDETNVKAVVSDETNVKAVVSDETNVKDVVIDETNVKSVVTDETNVKDVVTDKTNVNHPETLQRKMASIRRGRFTRENAERSSDVSEYMNAIPYFRNEPPEVDPEHNDELDDMNEDNNIAYSYTEDTDSSCNTSNHDGIQHQTNVESVVSDETNVKAVVSDETNVKAVVSDETNVKDVVIDETNVKSVVTDETNVKDVVTDKTNVNHPETLQRKMASIRRGRFTRENAERSSDEVETCLRVLPFHYNEPPEVNPEQNDELNVMNEDNIIAYPCSEDPNSSYNTSNHDGIQHQTNVKSVIPDETNVKNVASDETNVKDVVSDETNVKDVVSDKTNVKDVVSDKTNVKDVASDETNVKDVVSDETNVKDVVSDETNVKDVVSDKTNVKDVVSDKTNVKDVASDETNVKDVVSDETNVKDVVSDKTNVKDVVSDKTNVNHPGGSLNNHAEERLDIESLMRGASSSSQQNDLICEQYVQCSVQFQSAPSSNAALEQSQASNGGIHFSQSVHPSSGYSSN